MKPIRILVVDDSVVIRKLLTDTLSGDSTLEVVGTASDGRIALTKLSQLKPDLVTLDIENASNEWLGNAGWHSQIASQITGHYVQHAN